MVKYIIAALIIIAVAIIALLIYSFVKRVRITSACKDLLSKKISCAEKTDAILKLAFPKNNIISHVNLPLTFRDGNNHYIDCQNILISHGGVTVISSYDITGSIDNPTSGDWIQYSDNQAYKLDNLLELNQRRLHGIELILKHSEIDNVPLHSMIVLPSKDTKLRYRRDEMIRSGQILTKTLDLNKSRFLSGPEIKKVSNAIRKFAPEDSDANISSGSVPDSDAE